MVVVTSEPLGCVSVLTSVFLTAGVAVTSLPSLLSGAMAAMRLASLSTDDDTGTDLFGFFGTAGYKKKKMNQMKTKVKEIISIINKNILYIII